LRPNHSKIHVNSPLNNAAPQDSTTCSNGTYSIGTPGQHSQMRERFLYVEGREPGSRSTSPERGIRSARQPSAPSPKYFYESNPSHNEMTSAFPPVFTEQGARPVTAEPGADLEYPDDKAARPPPNWQTEGYHMPPAFLGPPADCYYCPSRRSPNPGSSHCYASTPSPFYHQADPNLQIPPHSIPFPPYTPPHAPQRFSYEQEIQLPRPLNPIMPNWPLEQPIIIAPHPANAERWVYDPQVMMSAGIPYCHPQIPAALPPNVSYQVPPNVPEPRAEAEQPQRRLHSPAGGRLHLRNRCSALHASSGNSEPAVPPERNQLNLVRIEDGQDTRTTVMIKNIPNKMSDKDLIAYIGKVCPRRIDFLYLRMDFQNGKVSNWGSRESYYLLRFVSQAAMLDMRS
jgi:hypothetical protein